MHTQHGHLLTSPSVTAQPKKNIQAHTQDTYRARIDTRPSEAQQDVTQTRQDRQAWRRGDWSGLRTQSASGNGGKHDWISPTLRLQISQPPNLPRHASASQLTGRQLLTTPLLTMPPSVSGSHCRACWSSSPLSGSNIGSNIYPVYSRQSRSSAESFCCPPATIYPPSLYLAWSRLGVRDGMSTTPTYTLTRCNGHFSSPRSNKQDSRWTGTVRRLIPHGFVSGLSHYPHA